MKEILIVGNPNTGKTTLFNTLTFSRERTGNYSGVTVKAKEREINYNNKKINIVDLPGVYSLGSTSKDEVATIKYLLAHKSSEVVFLCSSNTIKRNMVLLSELINLGIKNIKIIINLNGKKLGVTELGNLSQKLNTQILEIDVRKNKNKILDFLLDETKVCSISDLSLNELVNLFPSKWSTTKFLDRILLHNLWGKVVFFVLLGLIVFISYGPVGESLTNLVSVPINAIDNFIKQKFCGYPIFVDFYSKVITNGVGSLIVFLPQLGLMLTMLYLLEDSGYLPRIAYLFNLPLSKVGMNGKSIFSLVMGLGCTTSSYLCTRNIDDINSREQTAKMLPFVGCSARLPVLVLIISYVFCGMSAVYVLLLYLLSSFVGIIYLKLSNHQQKSQGFIVELPPIKRPSLIMSLKQASFIVIDLIKKILLTCFFVSFIVWLLLNINTNFKFFDGGESLLLWIGKKLAFIFVPIGFGEPGVIVAILSGLVAKENILSVLALFGGVQNLGKINLVSLILFILFYSPCVPALVSAKKEFGKKFMIKTIIIQTLIAYIASLVFYTFAFWGGLIVGLMVLCVAVLMGLCLSHNVSIPRCYNCNLKNVK